MKRNGRLPRIALGRTWPNGARSVEVRHRGINAWGTLYHNDDGTWCFALVNGRKYLITDLTQVHFPEENDDV